ncbi:MAG: hypothetical protein ACNI3A_11740 [Desulfovibrio sp.]|uniref:hypothetical protein n=1 Tax=Desulfovibrio sp. 7SRBS1 TaxID=3378064 RepID=UPI003B3EC6FD
MSEQASTFKNIGIDEQLHKQMKALAAIRGISLRDLYDTVIRDFVSTGMNKAANDDQ